MRIPFPERVSLWHAGAFAILLSALQLAAGTDPVFSLFCIFFILTAAVAFNVAGGLTRPSGSYVMFFAVLAVIVGLVTKVVLWEPAQSHLRVPHITIEAYAAGISSMLVAVYLSRRFSRKKGLLQDLLPLEKMRLAAIGCVIAGIGIPLLGQFANSGGENVFTPIFTAFYQLNRFLPMAIILGVTYEVKKSGGTRSFNVWVIIAWLYILFLGAILNFSKEALFSPPLSWLAACAASGYRFKRGQLIGGLLLFLFFARYLVPYCQYGRSFRSDTGTFSESYAIAYDLLTHLGDTKRHFDEDQANIDPAHSNNYYDRPLGLFDRLQMVSVDDALNDVTETNGALGLQPIYYYVANTVPRVFWPGKFSINMSNYYGREVGVISEEDYATSISFSPVAESYRLAKFSGVVFLAPVIWTVLFLMMDSLCGDLRKSPWGLLAFAMFAHTAPEGLLAGQIYTLSYGALIITVVAFFSAYLMPVLASLVAPPQRSFSPFEQNAPAVARRSSLTPALPPSGNS